MVEIRTWRGEQGREQEAKTWVQSYAVLNNKMCVLAPPQKNNICSLLRREFGELRDMLG